MFTLVTKFPMQELSLIPKLIELKGHVKVDHRKLNAKFEMKSQVGVDHKKVLFGMFWTDVAFEVSLSFSCDKCDKGAYYERKVPVQQNPKIITNKKFPFNFLWSTTTWLLS